MKNESWLTGLVAALAVALFSGCAAVVVGGAAGAGTYAYIRGELKTTQNTTLDRTWSATQAAMKELQFTITSQQKDSLQARLIAHTALDKNIEINLTKVTENLTELRIRVGTFGDEHLSRTILQNIEKRL